MKKQPIKILPLGNIIQIRVDKAQAGVLDVETRKTAVEYGEVVAVGDEVTLKVKAGDRVFFKAWAVDIVSHEDETYHFINPESGGILALVV